MKIITFLTDFGTDNGYVAQMKGVAAALTDARLYDITHEVTPHNIREGAFLLQTVAPYYPPGTIHVAVVDPGVGTERKALVITTRTQILIGPDNGLLIPAARFLGDFTVYEIIDTNQFMKSPSYTFHGRDVFTPVAARILNGVPFEKIGRKTTSWVDLDFGYADITDKTAQGKIIFIDRFGNIITNIPWFRLRDVTTYGKTMMVFLGEHNKEIPFVHSYGLVQKGEFLAMIGSSNYLEISMNQGNAAKTLSVKEDDLIKILFG
ncbi:MAG: S-adenosyl-l-methionine hydroxide adenosyltransferase family protein [Methanobacteriota archaeon]